MLYRGYIAKRKQTLIKSKNYKTITRSCAGVAGQDNILTRVAKNKTPLTANRQNLQQQFLLIAEHKKYREPKNFLFYFFKVEERKGDNE